MELRMPDTGNLEFARRCARLEKVLAATIAELATADPDVRMRIRAAALKGQPLSKPPIPADQGRYIKAIDALVGL